ncbi:hypothetical protein FBUS_04640 [Fasciolopsis buskii]|uniref:Uncharacterized protein n=1 Tax=Fasciolopsis buskii TaxID=27845 RepID=A0A8E0VIG6_9TREM|nr:hypothetical protein FBUS_04640 [Fasciolopsis buski]
MKPFIYGVSASDSTSTTTLLAFQGTILLQFDHREKIFDSVDSRPRACHDPSCLFTHVDAIIHGLVSDCEATTGEISLIRHVLLLRHQHTCDLRGPQHHSLFSQFTEQLPIPLSHPGHSSTSSHGDQSTHLTSLLPNL